MKISVVIPALNEAEQIVSCLDSIKTQHGEFEVIVVDGGSIDGTVDLAGAQARVIRSEKGRGVQMNSGARHCTGEVLLFLHADTRLPPEGLLFLERALADPRIVGGTFRLRFDDRTFLLRLIAFFTRFKCRYFHYGDQGIFVRRSVFEHLKGFAEIPLMEDVDFLRRLSKRGRLALLRQSVTTSGRRFMEHGIVRQQLLNSILVICYLLGAKPHSLIKWYERG